MWYFDTACHHPNGRIREVAQVHLLQSHGSSLSIKNFFFKCFILVTLRQCLWNINIFMTYFEIWDHINSFIILVFLLLVFWHSYIHLHMFEVILRFFPIKRFRISRELWVDWLLPCSALIFFLIEVLWEPWVYLFLIQSIQKHKIKTGVGCGYF